jgi:hypothetical protein
MSFASLLSLLLLAVSCIGAKAARIDLDRHDDGAHSVPLTRNFHLAGYHNIVELDRARARRLYEVGKGSQGDIVNVTNVGVTYVASVGVGSPPTICESTSLPQGSNSSFLYF